MSEDPWPNVCVVCSARGRQTRLKHGHCCAACADRITNDLRAIPELAAMAAASLVPGAGTTGSMSAAYGSKPPINLDAVDPSLAHVPGHDAPLLVLLEEWCRLIREERDFVPYGPASVAHATAVARTGLPASDPTYVTLVGVCGFLAAQVEWVVSEPDFPLEDFAAEVGECVRAVRRWDTMSDPQGTMVPCPTSTEDGDCGYRLRFSDNAEQVTCRRCGVTRDVATLILVALSDPESDVWADPEAIASQFGVAENTLRKWVRRDLIPPARHGLYSISAVSAMLREASA